MERVGERLRQMNRNEVFRNSDVNLQEVEMQFYITLATPQLHSYPDVILSIPRQVLPIPSAEWC